MKTENKRENLNPKTLEPIKSVGRPSANFNPEPLIKAMAQFPFILPLVL